MGKKITSEKEGGEIDIYKGEISTLTNTAKSLEIKDAESMRAATEMLSQLNKIADKITAEKEKVTKPLNEALKAERARWKPIETFYEETITILRKKMGDYQTEKLKAEKAEEAKIAGRVGAGKGKLTVETAVKKMGEIDRADSTIAGDAGMVKFRTDKKLKVWDETMVPREYLVLDEKKILADLKAGKQVAGCALEEVQVPINFR